MCPNDTLECISETFGSISRFEQAPETLEQSDFEELQMPKNSNYVSHFSNILFESVDDIMKRWKSTLKCIFYFMLTSAYFAYFGYAMNEERLRNEESIRLLWVTCVATFCSLAILFFRLSDTFSAVARIKDAIFHGPGSAAELIQKEVPSRVTNPLFYGGMIIFIVIILIMNVRRSGFYNLMSLSGIFLTTFIGYVGSAYRQRIIWKPVLGGLFIEFALAFLIHNTKAGFVVLKFLGDRTKELLSHSRAGSDFLFDGPSLHLEGYAFTILPNIIFIYSLICILYYLGVMQVVIRGLALVMQTVLDTTAGESLNAAANIFIGLAEAPMVIRPMLWRMTNSELHAVMSAGFATVSGGVMAAYITFGVSSTHLVLASFMSAPASLAMAKLLLPETKVSKTTAKHATKMARSGHSNLVEAAAAGAMMSIGVISNIAVNLISFFSLLRFLNATLTWFGARAGLHRPITFQFICSYLLWPVSFFLGVPSEDCGRVAELNGIKIVLSEFIAFNKLGELIRNREMFHNLTHEQRILRPTKIITDGTDFIVPALNTTFKNGFLMHHRSEVIATVILCGFSNISAMGVTVGALIAIIPHRQRDISRNVLRAFCAGNMACFLTACFEGLFYDESQNLKV